MSKQKSGVWAYAGFVQHKGDRSLHTGTFVYFELDTFSYEDVIPPPYLTVSIPHHGTVELKGYWGNIQEQIARDYSVTQQAVSIWVKGLHKNAPQTKPEEAES